jgi:hypothetical protein
MLDLQPIKARLAKITPGKWFIYNNQGEQPDGGWNVRVNDEVVTRQAYRQDAEFIANASRDITALLEEVERLNALVNAYKEIDDEFGAAELRQREIILSLTKENMQLKEDLSRLRIKATLAAATVEGFVPLGESETPGGGA